MKFGDVGRLVWFMVLGSISAINLVPALTRRTVTGDRDIWCLALGTEIARFCERCGPAATKLAQLMSSRADLLPARLVAGLARVQDRVPPPSIHAIRRGLRRSYGTLNTAPFTLVSWVPIASGSIAVVLEARTRQGEPIAIKLIRPGIERRIKGDLRLIIAVLRRAERLPAAQPFPLAAVVEELSELVIAQCDMAAEAANATRLAGILKDDAIVALPLPSLVRADAMAMQLIRGRYHMAEGVPPDIYRRACKQLLHALYRMIFHAGFVHCDLHPGNVAIDAEGKIILYDYGLVAKLRAKDIEIFRGLFAAVVMRNSRRATHELLRSATVVPADLDRVNFEAEAAIIVRRWSGKSAGEFLVAGLVRDLFELMHRHSIRSVPGFAAAVWALASFEGLVRVRYPDLDFQSEALFFLLAEHSARPSKYFERAATREKSM